MTDWQRIVTEHGPVVWRAVYRLLGDEELARDCYQETFLAAIKLSNTGAVENWQAMLRTLGTRKAIDMLRSRIRQRGRMNLQADPERLELRNGQGESASAEHGELVDAVRHLLADMPPRQAEAFALRHFEQMDNHEIAQRLDTSVRNVSVLIHRAAARLQQDLPVSLRQNDTVPGNSSGNISGTSGGTISGVPR